ncbi:MAG: ATP phosphoribosyltransferase regulatory subunit [Helicobacter sp.]|nr:ATP phosphoribosyltransferase regulatory subunit [Helicobacter sp.]MCI7484908.1 ATP phosphoribosyltransferase regulatory subunit [Helicobacter sp.]MDD7568086.1 ATP phosphoribosyltransferase regulatory subunit [Helicobacter sp.]MDY5741284.1 ATP phosphoribosyltransferase regulatory subunit [Helicobacter sp.]
MIFEHELPQGSKLYFDKSAKLKRDIENLAVQILYENGYKEIATPTFSFLAHQDDFSNRNMIRLSGEDNHQIVLRYDSTIDAMRTITKRISRASHHKKWFYIQPVYDYPTTELHQIGAECLDSQGLAPVMCLSALIINNLGLEPFLQICNQKIPMLCAQHLGLDIQAFSNPNIYALGQREHFLKELIQTHTKEDLQQTLKNAPNFLRDELESLLECASFCEYQKIIFSPLFCAPGGYYKGLFYRMFLKNEVLVIGGSYTISQTPSCGFAIYTDSIVTNLLKDTTRS